MKQPAYRTPLWRRIAKTAAWTLMALVLAVAAALLCVVRLLEPERLTPLVERVACDMLDADVSLGLVDLDFLGEAPFVKLTIDSLTVISRPMQRQRAAGTDIPHWADTLLTLEHFTGSINPLAVPLGRIELRDVIFTAPRINIFTIDEDHSNYLIYSSSDDTTQSASGPLPAISINRFAIERPLPLRFSNMATGEHFTLTLTSLSIDSDGRPVYKLSTGGDVNSPTLDAYNLEQLAFGVNGGVGWSAENPGRITLHDFSLKADFIDAKVNASVDMGHDIIVHDFDVSLGRMGIERILDVLPDSIRRAYDLTPAAFSTDAALSFTARSTAPFNLTTDSVPRATLQLVIEPGMMRLGQVRFEQIGGRLGAELRGNDLDSATFTVTDLIIRGPATDLRLNASATRVRHDPLVTGTLSGHTDLRRLPARLADLAGGLLRGHITMHVDFTGSPSMLDRNTFHRLRLRGNLDARDIYYLANDTNLMVYTERARFDFGTNEHTQHSDSLLTAVLRVDSADIVGGDAAISIKDFTLGLGTSNRHDSADTTRVNPMGGRLITGALNISLLGHATTIRMRGIDGSVAMTRYKNRSRSPEFTFDLGIGRFSVGSPATRFMISRSQLHLDAHQRRLSRTERATRRTADSLRRVHPDMPMDSVMAYALRKHRPDPRRRPRVHPQYTDSASEIIYWGTTDAVKTLLNDWVLNGSLKAARAGLFTASFPMRNRMRNLNATFNNDSLLLENVQFKAGSSDFLLSGRISNMRRAFTSPGFTSPLRLNFNMVSDTIDINELAGTAFRGAAVARAIDSDSTRHLSLDHLDIDEERADSALEHELGRIVADAPDSVAPLLVPTNIDLRFNMQARNVLYSDMTFTDCNGELVAYRGVLNLHHITARSDVGQLNLSALYSAPRGDELKMGFGLDVRDFNIHRFTRLMPALDSIVPMLRDFSGIIDADIAATCDIDSSMNLVLPSLAAAVNLSGDSLELISPRTYRTLGKWLLFKDKNRNIIDHMDIHFTVADNRLLLYPFILNIDRYRLGVQGYNDMAMNFDYHVAVLKSPIPFRFGINIKGDPEHYKIRLGRARFNENMPTDIALVDTARVNLMRQIENIFRRGVEGSRFRRLNVSSQPLAAGIDLGTDTITAADSAMFIREGLIPAPEPAPDADAPDKNKNKSKNKNKNKNKNGETPTGNREAVATRRQ